MKREDFVCSKVRYNREIDDPSHANAALQAVKYRRRRLLGRETFVREQLTIDNRANGLQ